MTRRMTNTTSEFRTRRLRLGLSQERLAERAATSKMHISRIDRNCVPGGQSARDVLALLLRLEQEAAE